MAPQTTPNKRHITEHEAENPTIPGWVRAAMRHKFGLVGRQHFDDANFMTDEEYADALRKVREHQPGLMEPKPAVPMPQPVAPTPPGKPTPAKPREE